MPLHRSVCNPHKTNFLMVCNLSVTFSLWTFCSPLLKHKYCICVWKQLQINWYNSFPVSSFPSLTRSLTFLLSHPFLLHGCLVNVAFCSSVNLKRKWEMASKAAIMFCMLIKVSFFRHFRNSSLLLVIVNGLKANRSAYWAKKKKKSHRNINFTAKYTCIFLC